MGVSLSDIKKIIKKYKPIKKIKIGKYKKRVDEKHKKHFNNIIKNINYKIKVVDLVSKSLILDSDDLLTCKSLIKCGYNKSQISSIDINKKTTLKHKKFGIKSKHGLLHEFLENVNHKYTYNNLIFDFQGTIEYFAYSAFLAIHNNYVSHNTLLVLTFSKRIKGHIYKNDKKKLIDDLLIVSNYHGYQFNVVDKYQYSNIGQGQQSIESLFLVFTKI